MQALKDIQEKLLRNANPQALAAHARLIPGTDNMYGVRMPVLNLLAKECKHGGFELVEALWQSGMMEEKILAAKILEKIAKQHPLKAIQLVKQFSKTISNWAVCDAPGMQALKPLVKTHQPAIFELANQLNKSGNPWQQRLSLVLVEWYTRDASWRKENDILPQF